MVNNCACVALAEGGWGLAKQGFETGGSTAELRAWAGVRLRGERATHATPRSLLESSYLVLLGCCLRRCRHEEHTGKNTC